MFTILLDSSNTSLSVGLAKDNEMLESVSYEAWQSQSEHMIPELNKLLEGHFIISWEKWNLYFSSSKERWY